MPVAHLVLEDLLLLRLEGLADTQPAATDSARDIADTTLVCEFTSDILIGVALLLEVNNASVVGVVVGLDGLGPSGLAAGDTNVAVIGVLVAPVGVGILSRKMELAKCNVRVKVLERKLGYESLTVLSRRPSLTMSEERSSEWAGRSAGSVVAMC